MTNRATFTLDEESYAFLVAASGKNRSAFVNALLRKEKQRLLAEKILSANLEEAGDAAYQKNLAEWDVTAFDGIDQ